MPKHSLLQSQQELVNYLWIYDIINSWVLYYAKTKLKTRIWNAVVWNSSQSKKVIACIGESLSRNNAEKWRLVGNKSHLDRPFIWPICKAPTIILISDSHLFLVFSLWTLQKEEEKIKLMTGQLQDLLFSRIVQTKLFTPKHYLMALIELLAWESSSNTDEAAWIHFVNCEKTQRTKWLLFFWKNISHLAWQELF